mmetsp:Transcript_2617/g.2990  ORF Transcript_2617/g.2990 Transcript_2617/m.2990 type:complete len:394 (+) Transcript_2617:70-1251(+)
MGNAGLQIQIEIHPNPQSIQNGTVVQLDHQPSWKITKNPFMAALSKRELLPDKDSQNQLTNGNVNVNANGNANMNGNIPPQQMQMPYGQPQVHPQGQVVQPPPKLPVTVDRYGNPREMVYAITSIRCKCKKSHAVIEGRTHYDFLSQTKEVSPPSTLYQAQTSIPFYFKADEKPHETYHGRNVTIRYFVRVLVERKFFPPIRHDQEIMFQLIKNAPRLNQPIKMEVGIEECLHIEFQYKKRYYHLNDVIEGDIHFMLVRIKIKYMELAVIRREMSGEGLIHNATANRGYQNNIPVGGGGNPNGRIGNGDGSGSVVTETQTLTRFEIMDGAPVKGEVIPVRLYLGGIAADLTPTYDNPNSRFAVRYYLNLVLVDEEDRRYFKQQEIILWRKSLG